MRINDMSVTPSTSMAGAFHLHADIAGQKFDLWFDDFGGFLRSAMEMGVVMNVRAGNLKAKQANEFLSRDVAELILPDAASVRKT